MDIIEQTFDPLDMNQYKIEKLPKREKNKTEKFLSFIGPPLALIVFLLLAFVLKPSFLQSFDPRNSRC